MDSAFARSPCFSAGCCHAGIRFSRALATVIVVIACVTGAAGCGQSSPPPESSAAAGPVTIEVKLDGKSQQVVLENVPDGSTIEEVMRRLDRVPVEISGSGSTAFLHSLAGKSTSAGGGWTFAVDGEFVSRGIGATELSPPATVTWTFRDSDSVFSGR